MLLVVGGFNAHDFTSGLRVSLCFNVFIWWSKIL